MTQSSVFGSLCLLPSLKQDRFCYILTLWPYMVPLFLVYAAEYTSLGPLRIGAYETQKGFSDVTYVRKFGQILTFGCSPRIFVWLLRNMSLDVFVQFVLPPGKLTWNLRITLVKRKNIFQTFIFGFHVKFRGCILFFSKLFLNKPIFFLYETSVKPFEDSSRILGSHGISRNGSCITTCLV